MDMDTLRAAVENTLSSISTISAQFTVTFTPEDMSNPNTQPWGPEHYEWAEASAMKYLSVLNPTAPRPLETYSFDGEQAYTYLQYAESGLNTLTIAEAVSPGGYWMSFTPNFMIGRRVFLTGRSLTDLMAAHPTLPVVREELAGHACWKVSFKGIPSEGGEALNIAVIVDPAHDYLPAKIEVRYDSEDPRIAESFFIHEVQEFRRILDEMQDRQRWFPKVFVFRQRGTQHKTVLDAIRINPAIPVSTFRPEPVAGTQVYDKKDNRRYVIGGVHAADNIVSRAAIEAKAALSEAPRQASNIDARPPTHSGFWWFTASFWTFAIVMMAFGVFCIYRKIR